MKWTETYAKAVTFSFDDGILQDEKLIQILNRYDLKATFNMNSGIFGQTHVDHQSGLTIKRFDADEKLPHIYKEHEIAVHSFTHPDLTKLIKDEIRHEIHQDILNLSNRFNQSMIGMAYPYGTYNDDIVSIIEEEELKYARTVYPDYGFKKQSDLLRFKPTCHFNDPNIHDIIHRFLFEQSEEPMILYLWGHSYECDTQNLWQHFESICKKLAHHQDIFYGTNAEVLLDDTEIHQKGI